jgi:AcrR family transcriptional regulator
LLDAMTATVAENGYAATSVAEVINRARASRRTFYEHFADKESCYLAAYTLASDYVAARIAEAFAGASTPADRLARLIRRYLEELVSYPLAARAFLVEIRAAGAPSQQHRRSIQDQFAELLRTPGSDDDPLMRTALVAANDELISRHITDNGVERLTELEPGLLELATRILTPTP